MTKEVNDVIRRLEERKDDIIGIAVAVQTRDGATGYNYYNEWKPITLIGEIECLKSALVLHNFENQRVFIEEEKQDD